MWIKSRQSGEISYINLDNTSNFLSECQKIIFHNQFELTSKITFKTEEECEIAMKKIGLALLKEHKICDLT